MAAVANTGMIAGLTDGGAVAGLSAIGGGAVELGALACAGIAMGGALVGVGVGWGLTRMYRQSVLTSAYVTRMSEWSRLGLEMPRQWEIEN